jgi:hypothetical protein
MNIRFSGVAMLALAIFAPAALAQVDCNESWRYDIAADAPFVWAEASTLVETPNGMRLLVVGHTVEPGAFEDSLVLAIWDGRSWESIAFPPQVLEVLAASIAAVPTADGFECVVGGYTIFDNGRADLGYATPRYRTGHGWDFLPLPPNGIIVYAQAVAVDDANTPRFLATDRAFSPQQNQPVIAFSDDQWSVFAPAAEGSGGFGFDGRFAFVGNDGTGERLYSSTADALRMFDPLSLSWNDITNNGFGITLNGPAIFQGQQAVLSSSGVLVGVPNEPVRVMRNGSFEDALPPLPNDLIFGGLPGTPLRAPHEHTRIAPICGRDALVNFGHLLVRQGTTSFARAFGWNGSEMIRFGQGISFEGVGDAEHHRGSFYVVGPFTSAGGVSVPGIARWGGPSDPLACPADATGDGRVDFADLNAVLSAFGNQQAAREAGDVTGDAIVDFSDLNDILSAFGDECAAR